MEKKVEKEIFNLYYWRGLRIFDIQKHIKKKFKLDLSRSDIAKVIIDSG